MDADTIVLLLLTMLAHASVAYISIVYVFKRKAKELESWLTGEKADELWDEVGDKVIQRIVIWLKESEQSKEILGALFDAASRAMLTRFQQWMGGIETGARNKARSIQDSIMEKIMGSIVAKLGGGQQ